MIEHLATGPALASRLQTLIGGLIDDSLPAHTGRRITAALDRIDAEQHRQAAIRQLAAHIDPDSRLKLWPRAQAVESLITRFESSTWIRVQRGEHTPQNAIERALVTILSDGNAPCARSIWNLLKLEF